MSPHRQPDMLAILFRQGLSRHMLTRSARSAIPRSLDEWFNYCTLMECRRTADTTRLWTFLPSRLALDRAGLQVDRSALG